VSFTQAAAGGGLAVLAGLAVAETAAAAAQVLLARLIAAGAVALVALAEAAAGLELLSCAILMLLQTQQV
jgi:hypothetical protein